MPGTRMQRVTIYFGESDRYGGKALYQALLELLRAEGAMGATVTRAIAGFGAHSNIRTASLVELAADLPLKLEWIDAPEQIERLLPELRRRVDDGMIVVEPIDVIQHGGGRQADPLGQSVSTIMRRGVTAATEEMPIAEVTNLLLARDYRALPVVNDEDKVVGVISDGDLLQLAGLKVRLSLQGDLSPAVLRQQFTELAQQTGRAQDYMTAPAVTVAADAPIYEAAQHMLDHHLKRLPVVDEADRLVGLVTRIDVLRLLDYNLPSSSRAKRLLSGATIADLMETEVPTVAPTATLSQVLAAMEESHQRRVLVVDGQASVVGIITDGDILERSRQGDSPGLLTRLRSAVTGGSSTTVALPEGDETAASLMSMPVTTVDVDAPLYEALDQMLWYGYKRLPVVDQARHLVGLLGRESLLRALMRDP